MPEGEMSFGTEDENPNATPGLGPAQHQPPPAAAPAPPAAKPPIMSTSHQSVGNATTPGAPWNPPTTGDPETDAGIAAGKVLTDLVTGDNPESGGVLHPEWGSITGAGLGPGKSALSLPTVAAQQTLSRDPAALWRVIKTQYPNAELKYDEYGQDGKPTARANPVVVIPSTGNEPPRPPMYLQRPGVTPEKMMYYGGQGAVAAATQGRSIPATAFRAGAQETASQLGSYALGGQEVPDPIAIAIATLLPFGIGAGMKVGAKGLELAFGTKPQTYADLVAKRAALLDQHGYTGTKGQVTGNTTQLQREDSVLNGPGQAGAPLKDLHDANYDQTQINKRQIIGEVDKVVPPGQTVPSTYMPAETDFGDRIGTGVRKYATDLEAKEDTAWGKLGPLTPTNPAGHSVGFLQPTADAAITDARAVIDKYAGAPIGPGGGYHESQLGGGLGTVLQQVKMLELRLRPTSTGPQTGYFNLGDLQDARQNLNAAIAQLGANPETRTGYAAAVEIKKKLDAAVDKALATQGGVVGDASKVVDFKAANDASREKFAFTHPDDPAAAAFMQKVLHGSGYDGQQIVNGVFGAGNIVTPTGGTAPIAIHLGNHLPPDSDAANAARAALTQRTLYGAGNSPEMELSKSDVGVRQPQYGSTATRIQGQVHGPGADVSTQLLPPDIRTRLSDFGRSLNVLSSAYAPTGPRLAPSGTAYALRTATKSTPVVGKFTEDLLADRTARQAIEHGIQIQKDVAAGKTPNVSLPREMPPGWWGQDPNRPWVPWQWQAGRDVAPYVRQGGLLAGPWLEQKGLEYGTGSR